MKTNDHCFNDVMNKHIKASVGVKREEEDTTEEQINRHDDSKFSLFECVTFATKCFKKEREFKSVSVIVNMGAVTIMFTIGIIQNTLSRGCQFHGDF